MPRWIKKITTRQENLRVTLSAIHDQPWDWWGWKTSSVYIALFTRYKLTRVRPGLKLTRVSFCRVNTANPGSTRVSLEKCRVNTTWVSFNPGRTRVSLLKLTRISFCRVNTANPGSTRVKSNLPPEGRNPG